MKPNLKATKTSKKNKKVAAILGFLFGPLGYLYIGWKYALMSLILFSIFTIVSMFLNLDLYSLEIYARFFARLPIMIVFGWKAYTICSIQNKLIEANDSFANRLHSFPIVTMAMTDLLIGVGMFYSGGLCIYASLKIIFGNNLFKGLVLLVVGTPIIVWTANFLFSIIAAGIDTIVSQKENNIFKPKK